MTRGIENVMAIKMGAMEIGEEVQGEKTYQDDKGCFRR